MISWLKVSAFAAVSGVTVGTALGAKSQSPTVQRWEYYAFIGGNINKEVPKLDSLGAAGWELVTVEPVSDNFVSTLYLRRPLP